MAIETFSMKMEDTPLEAFLAAAAEHRQGKEADGMTLGPGAWGVGIIGGVECRTMTWPVETKPELVANDNDPASPAPTGDETDTDTEQSA